MSSRSPSTISAPRSAKACARASTLCTNARTFSPSAIDSDTAGRPVSPVAPEMRTIFGTDGTDGTGGTDGLVIATPSQERSQPVSYSKALCDYGNNAPHTIWEKASIADGTHRRHRSIDVLHQPCGQSLTATSSAGARLCRYGHRRASLRPRRLTRPSKENLTANRGTSPG